MIFRKDGNPFCYPLYVPTKAPLIGVLLSLSILIKELRWRLILYQSQATILVFPTLYTLKKGKSLLVPLASKWQRFPLSYASSLRYPQRYHSLRILDYLRKVSPARLAKIYLVRIEAMMWKNVSNVWIKKTTCFTKVKLNSDGVTHDATTYSAKIFTKADSHFGPQWWWPLMDV